MIAKGMLAAVIVALFSFTAREGAIAEASSGDENVEALRARGPAALDELFAKRDGLIARREAAALEARPAMDRELVELESLIDQVGGQKHCTTSRLFWHTDFEKARAAAREARRPILTLRMMGRLTDEYSCANSRFFRATLYANRRIADLMRERFVLHWASVRPVPKVTIDYGDGRKLHRTLTGNSIHYVLDQHGRVIDGLPGLHAPDRFEGWLMQMATLGGSLGHVDGEKAAQAWIAAHHTMALNALADEWEADLKRVRAQPPAGDTPSAAPNAETASVRAVAKSGGERPLLPAVLTRLSTLGASRDAGAWDSVGALHAGEVRFDDATIAFIRKLNPVAALPPDERGAAFDEVLRQFQLAVAKDWVRNEYDLHRTIRQWLAEAPSCDVDALNERVYDELFLTPRSDPWVGLRPRDAFTALVDDGVEMPAQ